MKRLLLLFIAVSALFFAADAQQPTPTAAPADDQAVKISTNLIQVDVTVLDKNGKVVNGLSPSDFQLYENGQLQKITNFSFVSKQKSGAAISVGEQQQRAIEPNVSQRLKSSDVNRTIALVVDDLNLSFASVYYARRALLKFVNEQMAPGDLVAVIRTGGAVGALQQFTSNKQALRDAIEKIRWNPFSLLDPLTPVSQTGTEVTERFVSETDQLAAGKNSTVIHPHDNIDQLQKMSRNSDKNASDAQKAMLAQSSLGTLRYIVNGMGTLPGRKAMMLFSDGINIGEMLNNKSRSGAIYDFMQGFTDAANRSSVTIYTFDTRGMQSMAIAASDNTYEIIDGHRETKVKIREKDFRESQDGLVYMAEQTGGKALLNSNDLNGGIDRALDEQTGYYMLGYVPDAESFDPNKNKFNKFEIKVNNRPDLKVSYRSGFFNRAYSPEANAQFDVDKAIAASLMSPFAASDISLNINALYANDPVDGAYVRSFLHIDARNLTFSDTPDGWKTSTFDVAAVAFGNNGIPVDHVQTAYTIKSKGPTFDAMLKNGFVYVLMLPIKKPGVYQYRVALRDSASGKIGTASQVIGIPNLANQKLTMSSMAVEDVPVPIWQLITQGKVGNGTGQAQLKSTLLYDTVLRQFAPNTVLRYGFEVYNAKLDGSKSAHLEVEASIRQNDKTIIEGTMDKYDSPAGQPARVSGAVMLSEKLQPGEYGLEVTIKDPAGKQEAKQVFPFQVN